MNTQLQHHARAVSVDAPRGARVLARLSPLLSMKVWKCGCDESKHPRVTSGHAVLLRLSPVLTPDEISRRHEQYAKQLVEEEQAKCAELGSKYLREWGQITNCQKRARELLQKARQRWQSDGLKHWMGMSQHQAHQFKMIGQSQKILARSGKKAALTALIVHQKLSHQLKGLREMTQRRHVSQALHASLVWIETQRMVHKYKQGRDARQIRGALHSWHRVWQDLNPQAVLTDTAVKFFHKSSTISFFGSWRQIARITKPARVWMSQMETKGPRTMILPIKWSRLSSAQMKELILGLKIQHSANRCPMRAQLYIRLLERSLVNRSHAVARRRRCLTLLAIEHQDKSAAAEEAKRLLGTTATAILGDMIIDKLEGPAPTGEFSSYNNVSD